MKTVIATQSFKKVSAKQAELHPVLASKVGIQRPAVKFELPEYEVTDIASLVTEHAGVIVTCLNEALSQLSKSLFAAKPTEWDYKPSLDELSLVALAASFETVSRGRMLTLENAAKLGTWISKNMAAIVPLIQASEPAFQATQASAIVGVIVKYTAYEAKGAEFSEKVVIRLNQILSAIMESEELITDFMEDATLGGVMEALIKKFSKSVDEEITVDAL